MAPAPVASDHDLYTNLYHPHGAGSCHHDLHLGAETAPADPHMSTCIEHPKYLDLQGPEAQIRPTALADPALPGRNRTGPLGNANRPP